MQFTSPLGVQYTTDPVTGGIAGLTAGGTNIPFGVPIERASGMPT